MEWGRIPRLNNTNYQSWSLAVQALLRREQLWKFVDPGTGTPLTEDKKAPGTIQQTLEESQYYIIHDKTTTKSTWVALKEHHNMASLGQEVTLLKQITNQNYCLEESMEAYLSEIMKNCARLENSGFQMQECLKVALILRGLPDSFQPLTTALEARNEEELTLEMLKAKLVDEAEKQPEQKGELDEHVMKIMNQNSTIAQQ